MNLRWMVLGLMAAMLAGCSTSGQQTGATQAATPQAAAAQWDEVEAQKLEKFAVSQCLIAAFKGSPIEDDARRASGGYVELGTSPIETYDEIVGIVKAHRTTPYNSKSGKSLFVMQCLDLLHDPALEAIIRPGNL